MEENSEWICNKCEHTFILEDNEERVLKENGKIKVKCPHCKYIQTCERGNKAVPKSQKKEEINDSHSIWKFGEGVLLLIIIIIIGVMIINYNRSTSNTIDNPQIGPPLKVSDDQLISAYTSNKISANQEYQNKLVLITGTIYEIGQTFGTNYVMLREQDSYGILEYNGVQCDFSNTNQLMSLSKGQVVTLKGTISGFTGGIISIQDCSVYNG